VRGTKIFRFAVGEQAPRGYRSNAKSLLRQSATTVLEAAGCGDKKYTPRFEGCIFYV